MLKDFSQERFDVIIQAGQSNSEGYGFGAAETPYEPNDRVWYMNQDFTISRATEIVTGNEIQSTFVLAFAKEYLNSGLLKDGRKLLILRCAVGGTGFLDHHWGMTDDLYLRMMEMTKTALALNPENRLVAFLWHQGETDASLGASYEVHYRHLKELLDAVRSEFDAKTLPFIAGDFVQHWKQDNAKQCAPVIKAIRDVCSCGEYGAFVETDGLMSNKQAQPGNPNWGGDTIHFARESCYRLGRRYFAAYRGIVGF